MVSRTLVMAAGILFFAGCKNVAPDADQAAVIVDPTDASRSALQVAVNEALGTDVMLADDALTTTSILTVERKVPQSMSGSPAQGRMMDPPVRFDLMTNGSDCVLVDSRDGSRYLLANTRCAAR
jgi:hypothetical protein